MSAIKSVLCVPLWHSYGVRALFGKRCGAAVASLTLALGLSVAPAVAEPLRLVALGDSLTQGYGLPADEGFVPQLQDWLNAQGHDVIVINAGVSGDTTAGGLARLDWTLAEPVDAMLVTLGGNDLLRGIDPAASRANLDAILARLQQEDIPAMLAGMPAPGNYGPEFRDAFDRMYPELAREYDVALVPNFMQPMTDKADAGASFTDLMQGDHIHPNADGVALIIESIGPRVAAFLETVAPATP
ncbi:MAG: arylesterase [Rhodobacteraceae bacterium]|nr:arylesterase [Paracoccaceae bacterium]